jgi:hypothetical protein
MAAIDKQQSPILNNISGIEFIDWFGKKGLMKNQKSKRPKEQPPVSDGDSRPDQYPNTQKANVKKNKITSGRIADSNTMEDYKDSQ